MTFSTYVDNFEEVAERARETFVYENGREVHRLISGIW